MIVLTHQTHEQARFLHFQESKEMHPLCCSLAQDARAYEHILTIVRLFKESLHPAVVTLHSPQAVQMSHHTSDHSRNTSNALEEQISNEVSLLEIQYHIVC